MTELKGKYFSLLNFDGSLLKKIKIDFVRKETSNSITHPDGSFSPTFTYSLVSEDGHGWYRVYGGNFDTITSK